VKGVGGGNYLLGAGGYGMRGGASVAGGGPAYRPAIEIWPAHSGDGGDASLLVPYFLSILIIHIYEDISFYLTDVFRMESGMGYQ
jgi:hypothetical protein